MSVQKIIQDIRVALKAGLKEREALVDGTLIALLSKEPFFVLGPPGTGKTLACEKICEAIGGNYFSVAMTKFTTPEELFGPLSIKGLQEDKYVRITTNKLPEADIAFLDEGFKGSSAILNTLLPIANERVFYNGGKTHIPLQALYVASNETPQGEELGAMWDRMVLRYVVAPIKNPDNILEIIMNGGAKFSVPHISKQELTEAQEAVANMPFPMEAALKTRDLWQAVNDKDIYVSTRKWAKVKCLAQAFAFLQGHSQVEIEDLVILENVLWNQPDQIAEIRALVRKLCNPVAEVLARHTDAANEVMIQIKSKKIGDMEAFRKMKASKEDLEVLYSQNEREDVREAIELVGKHLEVLSNILFKAPAKK
jgi:MoxR-like ATPase